MAVINVTNVTISNANYIVLYLFLGKLSTIGHITKYRGMSVKRYFWHGNFQTTLFTNRTYKFFICCYL